MINLDLFEKQAIDAAINFDWKKAIELNGNIIKIDKKNQNAYLRLAFAYLQNSEFSKSREYYQRVLRLQPGNQIAKQNLERLKILEKGGRKKGKKQVINLDPNLFLEFPGKTKSVALVNLGQKDVIAQLSIGQKVQLIEKKRRIEIRTKNKDYIGCLPDDLSKRLILFLESQSIYVAFVKEASLNRVIVFMREEKKGHKVTRFISFPSQPTVNLEKMAESKAGKESDDELDEEITQHELEKMAEDLNEEEKIYLPYGSRGEEEEEEE